MPVELPEGVAIKMVRTSSINKVATPTTEWMLDTCASINICNNRALFTSYTYGVRLETNGYDGSIAYTEGIGTVHIDLPHGYIDVHDVYYLPHFDLVLVMCRNCPGKVFCAVYCVVS